MEHQLITGDINHWFRIQGDLTLRLDYDLGPDSLIFDLGAFEGAWSSRMFQRYGCNVRAFEVLRKYYEATRRVLPVSDKIEVNHFGLGAKDESVNVVILGDSSSMIRHQQHPEAEVCRIVDVARYMEESRTSRVDVMKINIEGAEFDLLERMLEKQLVSRIDNIQVQFHDIGSETQHRFAGLQRRLSETHRLTYDFGMVWQNWKFAK